MAFMDKTINEILERGVEKVLPSKTSLSSLMEKKKIRLFQGIDPTANKLHLGHTVGLRKLMQFANLGHEVILLFGTGTVLVGDPSERNTGRKLITKKEVMENIETWKKQVSPIVDFDKITLKYNGDWLTKLTFEEIIKIASNISAVQLFKRDSFQRRTKKGDTVWYHETLYPLLQGYDSVAMDVNLEIGGTDQEFNMLIGRELQKKMNRHEKYVLTVPMILGTDGNQMSKTSGNCVWLTDTANDMFVKIMGILDKQIIPYMELVTDIPLTRINKVKKSLALEKLHPIDAKKELALSVVGQFHGKSGATKAQKYFERTFQERKPTFEKQVSFGNTLLSVVATQVESKSKAKRLIVNSAVSVNNEIVNNPKSQLAGGEKIKIGKKIFVTVKSKK